MSLPTPPNPDKFIRKYFSEAMNNEGIAVFEDRTGTNTPKLYALLSTQSKQLAKNNKCGYGWNCTLTIELTQRRTSTANVGGKLHLNDMEAKIYPIFNNFALNGFGVRNKSISSTSLTTNGVTVNIDRIIITINLELE